MRTYRTYPVIHKNNDFARYFALPFPRELKYESRVFTVA